MFNTCGQTVQCSGMEASRKKQKMIAEECELLINIDTNGACYFDIVSKIESVCDDEQNSVSPIKPECDVHKGMMSEIGSVCDSDRTVDLYACRKGNDAFLQSDVVDNTTVVGKDKMGTSECKDGKVVAHYHIPECGSSRSILFCGNTTSTSRQSQYDSSPMQLDEQKTTQSDGGDSNLKVEIIATDTKDVAGFTSGIPPTSQYLALDCEFVGVLHDKSALGRCSIVNFEGEVICDIYARPLEAITTYRTPWSGITKKHMKQAIPIESALSQISDIIQNKIVVGHGLHNDFGVLGFGHPEHLTRDTQKCEALRRQMDMKDGKQQLSLKSLALKLLGQRIQTGAHCSVIDARTAMDLYKLVRQQWETSLQQNGLQQCSTRASYQSIKNLDKTVETGLENNKNNTNSLDTVLNLNCIQNGKIHKRKRAKRKIHRLPAHFGQMIAGNRRLKDYIREDATVSNKDKFGVSEFLKKQSAAWEMENCSTIPVDEGITTGTLQHCTNVSSTAACSQKDDNRLHRRKFATNKNKDKPVYVKKSWLKTNYAETAKHLFQDQFWPVSQMPADTDDH